MNDMMEDLKGGSGVCPYCLEHVSNVAYHSSKQCRQNPELTDYFEKHDQEMARRILGKGAVQVTPPDTNIYEFNFNNHLVEILVEYDFSKVESIMKHLDWKWAQSGGASVPSASKIRQNSVALLRQAYEDALKSPEKQGMVESGGILAAVNIREDTVELSFIGERWTSVNRTST